MTRIDGTKYLRQMKSKPDFSMLLLGLLILSVIGGFIFTPLQSHCSSLSRPESKYYNYEMNPERLLHVYILLDGVVYVDDVEVEKVSELAGLINEYLKDSKNHVEGIALDADCCTEFGHISEVLEQIQKADIRRVFFVTNGKLALWKIMADKNVNSYSRVRLGGKQ